MGSYAPLGGKALELEDPNGSDFTIGAVDHSGEMGNFFVGQMTGLCMYNRAHTPAEIFALAQK